MELTPGARSTGARPDPVERLGGAETAVWRHPVASHPPVHPLEGRRWCPRLESLFLMRARLADTLPRGLCSDRRVCAQPAAQRACTSQRRPGRPPACPRGSLACPYNRTACLPTPRLEAVQRLTRPQLTRGQAQLTPEPRARFPRAGSTPGLERARLRSRTGGMYGPGASRAPVEHAEPGGPRDGSRLQVDPRRLERALFRPESDPSLT